MSYFDDNEDYITGIKFPKAIEALAKNFTNTFQPHKEYKKLNITLLNINHSTKTAKNGKPYQIAELAYKNNTFQGKVEGFKVTSYMKAYADIAAAQIGDTFDVTVEKGQSGYNEWTTAHKAVPGASVPAGIPSKASTPYTEPPIKAASSFGRDFETKEERAKKQVYIVRQSSIANAVAMLTAGAKSAPKVDDVLAVARELESYVLATGDVSELNPDFKPAEEPDF